MMEAIAEITAAVKNVPALRFPEFEGEWGVDSLTNLYSQIVVGFVGTVSNHYCNQLEGVQFVRTQNVREGRFSNEGFEYVTPEFHKKNKKSQVKNGDILIARVGANMGMVCEIKGLEGEANSANVVIIKQQEELSSSFYSLFLTSPQGQKLIQSKGAGGAQEVFNISVAKTIKVPVLSLPEQQKIAFFLSAADEKIQQLSKKKELLEKYKKGVMQQIFSQQIRFKDDKGEDFSEWKEKRLGLVFERVKTKNAENNKNVLTISAQHGLINQEDFFNKSVSAENVTGYYLLHKGDFAYNKSYSKGYPMGAIKRLNIYDKGVVSTLYICFRIKDDSSGEYFEQYFNSGNLNSELHKIAQEGARNHGLLNMSVVEFFNDIKLPRPSEKEQIKIANFLTSIDNKINNTSKQLEQAQNFKKGLLQQMFV